MRAYAFVLALVAGIAALVQPVLAQTPQQQADHAAGTAGAAAAGVPLWVWIVVAVVVVLLIVFALARRRRSEAVIKTRLG